MKKFFYVVPFVLFSVSCASTKSAATAPTKHNETSLEGEIVNVETVQMQGIEMAQTLNDDGTEMISRPYKWFAGIGKADNKQVAIELAQREAYATISRVLTNAVWDQAKRGNAANNGKVVQALTSLWEQVSSTIQSGCEPFGDMEIEYSPSTRMYNVTAKVAIRGDRFNQLLNSAGNFKPQNLDETELRQFLDINKAILEAAKGN